MSRARVVVALLGILAVPGCPGSFDRFHPAGDTGPLPDGGGFDTLEPTDTGRLDAPPDVPLPDDVRVMDIGPGDVGETFTIVVEKDGDGDGTVTSATPAGAIDCGTDCDETLATGTLVVLRATASAGSSFIGWSGEGCAGTGFCTVSVDMARVVTARFDRNRHPVDITIVGEGVVRSSDTGMSIDCGGTSTRCSATIAEGDTLPLDATSVAPWAFAGWTGDGCTGTAPACPLVVTGPMMVTATFADTRYPLDVTRVGTGRGRVTSAPGGIDCGATCTELFGRDLMVTLTAAADPGSTFDGWSGAGCTGTGDCTITMSAARTVSASFTLDRHDVRVAPDGSSTGTGRVTSLPAAIDCGTACIGTYDYGTMVSLVVEADVGSSFTGWATGPCVGTTRTVCTFVVTGPVDANPTFTRNRYTLTASRAGAGSGLVVSDPSGISCGVDCITSYDHGTSVTLTAVASTGSRFTGWSGSGCSGVSPTCVINMLAAQTAVATFALETLGLTVATGGDGTGSVVSDVGGIACPGTSCMASYTFGTRVMLTASVGAGSTFAGWGGACTGTSLTCMTTITEATSVTATYVLGTNVLTIDKVGRGSGTVASLPAGIACGATCGAAYTFGTDVTLTATPDVGSRFTGWSGAGCSGSGTCVVRVENAVSVTASFDLLQYPLTVGPSGGGTGTISSVGPGIACGADCSEDYDYGTMVTLTASASATSTFVGWSGACTGAGATCAVTMDAAQNVTATFDLRQYALTVMPAGTGGGTVSSSPLGIDCGADCSETYDHGTVVTLTAAPDGTSTFVGWSGGGCTGIGTCVVTVTAATTVTATFTPMQRTLTVTRAGTGTGTVTSSPAGIACGSDCTEGFDHGSMVTLTAAADASSTFTGWTGGGCSGAATTCVVSMTAATNVTATFTLRSYILTAARTGLGTGTVTSSPAGISCGGTCSAAYDHGTMVTLSASPDASSTFAGWTGGTCTGSTMPTCVVTLTAATTVSAAFDLRVETLTVARDGTGAGSVTSAPTGISCGADCTEAYTYGSMVTLSASGSVGSDFSGWSGGGCSGTGTCVVTVTAATTVTATFTLRSYVLTAARAGTGSGSVTSAPAGISCGSDCTETYDHGTSITLTATADASSTFTGWSGGGCSGTGTCVVALTAATTVTATFDLRSWVLTVNTSGTGTGSVASVPAGITCGADCTESYVHGTMVTLTATAGAGSTFAGWGGACTGVGTCVVTMDAVKTATATFTLGSNILSVSKAGTGAGTVSSAPAGIDCGATCGAGYTFGTVVTLTATPTTGSTFTGWSGGCSGAASTCMVTMDMSRSVTATFTLNTYALTVARMGTGTGTVSSAPAGISCGVDCTETLGHGTMVTLTATADPSSTFTSWGGACSGAASTCVVTMDMARSVTASFAIRRWTLTVARAGAGSGTVTSAPIGVSCGVDCTEDYDHGTVVTLTAAPDAASTFTGWSGACSGVGTCMVTMDQARSATATFAVRRWTLTATRTGTGTGTVTSNPTGVSCGVDCTEDYDHGTMVTLTAAADVSSTFTAWTGACTGSMTTCVVTMDMARSVTAQFTLRQYTLTVTRDGTGAGTVTSAPVGVTCGSDCSEPYNYATSVTLTASPTTGSDFSGWSGGGCMGTGTCVVSMTAAATVNATFTLRRYTLSVTRSGTGAGTVTSSPAGVSCGSDCSELYDHGTMVTLTASPAFGASFTGWSGGGCTGSGTCAVTMDMARTVDAQFTLLQQPLTVVRSGPGSGAVDSSPAGISCGADCTESYTHGTTVTLTATPAVGSDFSNWSGACAGTVPSCIVTMDGAKTATATFVLEQRTLTVATSGTGTGSVTSAPAGIACGADCAENYDYGQMVTLTATPDPSSTFAGWTGACTGLGTCMVTMDMARSATATFTLRRWTLTASRNGTGTGTVTSSPVGVSCGVDCTEDYDHGTMVTLTATADVSSTFTAWTGACTGSMPTCVVTMDMARTVAAQFTIRQYTLTVSRAGTGTGTVTSAPTGISCGGDCTEPYNYGTMVTLTASPDAGSSFAGWGGACTGVGTCMVTMDAAKSVTATFTLGTNILTVTKNGTGAGTVSSSPAGIDCGATCGSSFAFGTMVTLTATPTTGSTFTGWSGACSGMSSTCLVTMDMARSVTATFTLNTYALTVVRAGTGTGMVTSSPTGISCGGDCSEIYGHGTMVTLTATADPSSTFTGWSGSCSGASSTCLVTMDMARSATATFTIRTWTLTVLRAGAGTGSVSSAPAGISCGGDCTEAYTHGTMVMLTATSDVSSSFAGWSGACSGLSPTCTVTMDQARSVTATFSLRRWTLTTTRSGAGSGTVTSAPTGISCGSDCTEDYDHGTSVTLTATPAFGSDFAGWSGGGCSGLASTCVITMDMARTVNAQFVVEVHSLDVFLAGAGLGAVNLSPPGINCGTDCTQVYDHGTMVILTATESIGSTFAGWTGACASAGFSSTCVITMDAALSVTATFALEVHTLTVSVNGSGTDSGSGSVTSSPTGIACEFDCREDYDYGTMVTLTATPDVGSDFAGWGGACSGLSPTCVVSMTSAQFVSASFVVESHRITAAKVGSGASGGTIASSPPGITCGADCSEFYEYGTFLTLTATTDATAEFVMWTTGPCAGSTSPVCSGTVTGTGTITAQFRARYLVGVVLNGTGLGGFSPYVTSSPAGISCAAGGALSTCSERFADGTMLTLTATPPPWATFVNWGAGPCSATLGPVCTFTVSSATGVAPTFNRIANLVFVTSTTHDGNLGGIAGADGICRARAGEQNLPGTWVAWISTGAVNAMAQLSTARGWVDLHGLVFSDTVGDITTLGRIYHPIIYSETGARVGVPYSAWTGTRPNGTFNTNRCGDWTMSGGAMFGDAGDATGQTVQWTNSGNALCTTTRHIYCFTRDLNVPLAPPAMPTRIAFVSAGTFAPSAASSIATADTLCQNEATMRAYPGSYRAFLATSTASAASRFPTSLIYYRLDGYRLGTVDQLFGGSGFDGFLESELNQDSMGGYLGALVTNVWTGMDNGPNATSFVTCNDWSSSVGMGTAGLATSVLNWSDSGNLGCASGRRVYCLRYDNAGSIDGGGTDGGIAMGGTDG